MFIFIRLLLAHLIGDYLLQSNKIYKCKSEGLRGVLPHIVLITICLLVFSWPYLKLPSLWIFIFFIAITHLLQDWIKVNYIKVSGDFWVYLLDQVLHIAIVATVFLTDLTNIQPSKSTGGFIVVIYNNNLILVYLIALITATYNGFYLISNFRNTFLGVVCEYNAFKKWYGVLERAGVVSIFFLGGFFFLLIPIVFFLRPIVFALGKNRFNIDQQFVSRSEIALSWTIAGITGIILYLIMR